MGGGKRESIFETRAGRAFTVDQVEPFWVPIAKSARRLLFVFSVESMKYSVVV